MDLGLSGGDVPQFYLWALAQTNSVAELRKMLHNAELELFAADYWGDVDAWFWEQIVNWCRKAIPFRQHIDRYRAARKSGKQTKRIDFTEIKDKVDIVEYIGRYVKLKKSGKGFLGACPFHADSTPSFWVWPEIKAFRCFGCDARGDVITFKRLMTARGLL